MNKLISWFTNETQCLHYRILSIPPTPSLKHLFSCASIRCPISDSGHEISKTIIFQHFSDIWGNTICVLVKKLRINPIRPGGGGGSARADFNFWELPWYLSNTDQIWPLLLEFIGEQDSAKMLRQEYYMLL